MTSDATPVEVLVRHERHIVVAGLIGITALAWAWLLNGAGTGMSVMAMTTWSFPPPIHLSFVEDWSPGYAILMFLMWWIMMIAMMTPSAAPVILLYARAYRREQKLGKIGSGLVPTQSFLLGYLVSWMAFSAAATCLQWSFERAGLVHAMLMWSINASFSAVLLIVAGVFQFSALKNACLAQCRSPAQFLAGNFRSGVSGAFQIGFKHGLFCLGCCWALMALLFVGGAMNLVWIAGLTILVLIEKMSRAGPAIARAAGLLMIASGIWILCSPLFG